MLRITESEFPHLGNNGINILLKYVIRDVLCNSWLWLFKAKTLAYVILKSKV